MNEYTKKAIGASGSLLLLASMGATAMAAAPQAASAEEGQALEWEADQGATKVQEKTVEGTFSFSQEAVTPTDVIRKGFAQIPRHLCGSDPAALETSDMDANDWSLTVGGDVENAYTATLGELSEEGSAQLVMGCTCAGNPAVGQASVNADVLGVRMAHIASLAKPAETVNTVVFTSSDGFEVALPAIYVQQHFSLIAYRINGEPVANSMGGVNQLWLGSTAASYFARNVESITFETRQTPPPVPGTEEAGDAYANVPSVSFTEGGEAA